METLQLQAIRAWIIVVIEQPENEGKISEGGSKFKWSLCDCLLYGCCVYLYFIEDVRTLIMMYSMFVISIFKID